MSTPIPRAPDILARATVALLIAALALMVALGYRAHAEVRAHRATAERAVAEYASFATWQLATQVRTELQGTTFGLFSVASVATLGDAPDAMLSAGEFALALAREARSCRCAGRPVLVFRADLVDSTLAVVDSHGRETMALLWLRDSLLRRLPRAAAGATTAAVERRAEIIKQRTPDSRVIRRSITRTPFFFHADVRGERLLFVQEVMQSPGERAGWIYGFATQPGEFYRPILARVWERSRLLPPSLVGDRPSDNVLAVRVSDAAGMDLFSVGRLDRSAQAVDTLSRQYAGLRFAAALLPATAANLFVGGRPAGWTQILLGVLVVVVGLVAILAVQLRRQAALARMRSDFVSGVSHELRTPLTQIRLLAELLTMGQPASEQGRRESARIIDQEARRLTNLVQNVLSFSRAERGKEPLVAEPSDLSVEAAQAIDVFLPLANAESVTIRRELQEDVQAVVDRFALRQVLLNLLDNAVRYGGSGRLVTVRTWAQEGWSFIGVEDQGPGIPDAEQARIWQPFYRLARDAATVRGGSGIGLAVVKQIVDRHGGTVSVSNRAAGGALFVVGFRRHIPSRDDRPQEKASDNSPHAVEVR